MKDQNKTNDPAEEPKANSVNKEDILNRSRANSSSVHPTSIEPITNSTHTPEFTIIPENKPATIKDVLHVFQIMHDKGFLNKEEYESEKKKLLN